MPTRIYVQEVITYWTKASRGAPEASVRNSLQEAFPLTKAEIQLLEHDECYSCIVMREGAGFRVEQSVQKFGYLGHYKWPSLSIQALNQNIFTVRYKYSNVIEGMPNRSDHSAISHELEIDKLLQVKFNSRDSHPTGEWYYCLKIFNILFNIVYSYANFINV